MSDVLALLTCRRVQISPAFSRVSLKLHRNLVDASLNRASSAQPLAATAEERWNNASDFVLDKHFLREKTLLVLGAGGWWCVGTRDIPGLRRRVNGFEGMRPSRGKIAKEIDDDNVGHMTQRGLLAYHTHTLGTWHASLHHI